MKTLRTILTTLTLMALFALPAAAQEETITITLTCYDEPEGVTLANNTDEDITITGVTSSFEADGDPERSVNVTVAAGTTETVVIGGENPGGGDNIFNNEEDESATVYTSAGTFSLSCSTGSETIDFGTDGGQTVEATEVPVIEETPETQASPEVAATPDNVQGDVADDQQDVPEEMPDTGAGALSGAPGAAAVLLLAGVGLLRLRGR